MEKYLIHEGKKLRYGYTTGSCAQAATKAAGLGLLTGEIPDFIEIETPENVLLTLEVLDKTIGENEVSCAIRKDAGDDPDVTDGILIYSRVKKSVDGEIHIYGAEGVGIITRKNLFGKIGDPAINPVPLKMIRKELENLGGGLSAEIYVPEGEAIAKRTFNSQLGIKGGISIIGTTGLVKPMSTEALLKTIYLEIDMIAEENLDTGIAFVPGAYGEELYRKSDINLQVVKVSNYMGDALMYAASLGFRKIVVFGHVGKLSKLSIGIFNTHNRIADGRKESFIYYLALEGENKEIIDAVNESQSAEQIVEILLDKGKKYIFTEMKKGIEERVKAYLKNSSLDISVYMYSMERGLL